MAYGGLMGQAPESGAPISGLPTNDVRQLIVKDGENINAGDVVDVGVDGVYKNLIGQENVETNFSTYITRQPSICKLKPDTAIVFYRPESSNGSVKILTLLKDGSISAGAEASFSGNIDNSDIVRLSDSQAICFYSETTDEYMGLRLINVSGTTCTFGAENKLVSQVGSGKLIPISENQCAIFYSYGTNGSKLYAKMLTINGNTIKQGTQYALGNAATGVNSLAVQRLPDGDNGDIRIFVCFTDYNNGNYGKALIATINSSNTITFGNVVTFEPSLIKTDILSCCENNGDIIMLYSCNTGNGEKLYTKVLTISNDLITLNPSILAEDYATTNCSIVSGENSIVATFQVSGNPFATALALIREENSIILGKRYEFTDKTTFYLSVVNIEKDKFIAAYQKKSITNGFATVLSVHNNQIAGSFINNSKTAIALQSGTSGQTIPVGFGGYCACDGITAGQSINSIGVMAYSPLDGWLDIRPEYSQAFVWETIIDENFKGITDSNSYYTLKEKFLSNIDLSNYALLRIKTSIGPETTGSYNIQINSVDVNNLTLTVGKTYNTVVTNCFNEFYAPNNTQNWFDSTSSLGIRNGSRQKYDFNIKVFGLKF